MKILIKLVVGVILLLSLVITYNTVTFRATSDAQAELLTTSVDVDTVVSNMRKAITFQTISYADDIAPDDKAFGGFLRFLEQAYPASHSVMERQLFSDYTALFVWQGSDPSLLPVLVTGHYDVVPVIAGTEKLWVAPPFDAEIHNGFIYGRGALDDKSAVIAMMEAAEALVKAGFSPKRTVYIALGHDEEIGGVRGAGAVVKHFQDKNIRLAWSLDEGSFVVDGILPVSKPVAMVNVAEKGWMSMDLVANDIGGHSSMPPEKTAVVKLAEAIIKVQQSPLEGGLSGVAEDMIVNLGPHLPLSQRILIANRWLFGSLLESALAASPAMNASMRTTVAPTMLEASLKENVLPIEARARVNLRLHPRDTPESVQQHYEQALTGMDDVSIEVGRASNASSVASVESQGFEEISQTVKGVFGDVVITSGITVAGTDSRHYEKVADNAYRFNPVQVSSEDISGFHGTNERISIKNLELAVRFYQTLLNQQ